MRSCIGKRADRLAAEVHRLGAAALHAELAAQEQHHVLGDHAWAELPRHSISIVSGTREPDLAGCEHARHLGRADAEHVGAERAAGRRMAVAADHEHAGLEMPALRQHDMADAFAVVEAAELVLGRESARDLADAAGLVVACRHVVIADQHDLARVPQPDAEALEDRRHAARSAGVVDHREIDGAGDDLAGHDALASGRARDDLLGQRHRHLVLPHCHVCA